MSLFMGPNDEPYEFHLISTQHDKKFCRTRGKESISLPLCVVLTQYHCVNGIRTFLTLKPAYEYIYPQSSATLKLQSIQTYMLKYYLIFICIVLLSLT